MEKKHYLYIFEIMTVGITFSIFKFIFGQFLTTQNYTLLGNIISIWGVLDFIINFLNLFFIFILKKRLLRTCLLNYLVTPIFYFFPLVHHGAKDFGDAIDVMLSFIIVSIMVGGGYLNILSRNQQIIWSCCVILNVLSAGINRLLDTTKRIEIQSIR